MLLVCMVEKKLEKSKVEYGIYMKFLVEWWQHFHFLRFLCNSSVRDDRKRRPESGSPSSAFFLFSFSFADVS